MAATVFLDCETTGLDPARHEVWEVGAIVTGHRDHSNDGEWLWQLKPDLAAADPNGLRVSRYYQREQLWRTSGSAVILASPWWKPEKRSVPFPSEGTSRAEVAERLARILDGAHLVGAVPSFDAAFLEPFLRRHGQAACWHYHLIDVEALAVGYLAGRWTQARADGMAAEAGPFVVPMPWDSDALSSAIGIAVSDEDKHTALGDARWAKAMYDAVLGAEEVTAQATGP